VGWHLRLDDADLEETIVVVRERSEITAVALVESGGASGVTVQTPLSNTAAVRAYESCGLRAIDHLRALRYPSPDS
jgi:hypothetical protein